MVWNLPFVIASALLPNAMVQADVPAAGSSVAIPPTGVPRSEILVRWVPGEVRCGGAIVTGAELRRPYNSIVGYAIDPTTAVHLRFVIDARGRAISIADSDSEMGQPFSDFAPALASSRFPVNAPKSECRITYVAEYTPVSDALIEDLVAYTMNPVGYRLPEAGRRRIYSLGNCAPPNEPPVRERAYPNFERVSGTQGVRDWSLVQFDIDANGRPVNLSTRFSTRNVVLDSASLEAASHSRFEPGSARSNCLYAYWRAAERLEAPDMPDELASRPAGGNCSSDVTWARAPDISFPRLYNRRKIEGWAIITYDLTASGEPNNVRIADAQPSRDFGFHASRAISAARAQNMGKGITGCVQSFRFHIPERGSAFDLIDTSVEIF